MELVGDGTSYTPPINVKQVDLREQSHNGANLKQAEWEERGPQAPSSDLVDLTEFAAAVKSLRTCENATSGKPPMFTLAQSKDGAALAAEYAASRGRLYTWLLAKGVGNGDGVALPDLSELDDQSLIDLATTTAGL